MTISSLRKKNRTNTRSQSHAQSSVKSAGGFTDRKISDRPAALCQLLNGSWPFFFFISGLLTEGNRAHEASSTEPQLTGRVHKPPWCVGFNDTRRQTTKPALTSEKTKGRTHGPLQADNGRSRPLSQNQDGDGDRSS